ncbi:MAG: L,D-transpeptidase family protein [Gammaproteobacteria bacterium]|nr:L,D-transpeptidase family protein [Gammaproteobacteria bacterium]
MNKTYSKLLGILAICYGGIATAEQVAPDLLQGEPNVAFEGVFDTNESIFQIKEEPPLFESEGIQDPDFKPESLPVIPPQDNKIESVALPIDTPEKVQVLPSNTQPAIQPLEINPNPVEPLPRPVQPSMPVSSSRIADVLNFNHIEWNGTNNRLKSPDEVRTLYGQLNYQPLWTDNGKVSRLAAQVIRAIGDAPKHALRSELYHSGVLSSFQAGQPISDPVKFDVLVSDAFITYKSHLANGIVDPKAQFPDWNKKPTFMDFTSLYVNAQSTGNIANIFTVNDHDYRVLQAAYEKAKGNSTDKNIPRIPAKSLRPGAKGKAVQILRQRLGLDTSIDIYDNDLKQAVKDYQRSKGLKADGYAGRRTLRLLNGLSSSKAHLQTLAINMERRRWSYVPNSTYLQVNIPAFKMAIRQGKKRLFESNVIVGKPKRATPIFSDVLETVVLAPYWNVPKTIFEEDKLPKLQKDPNHFGKNMQVIDKATGKVVDSSKVNWKKGGVGYRLRQKPGAKNALGRMKFLFPNRHAIYLHDTNNRRLFKRSKRAFSSGCIRVERAEDLAVFLLKDRNYDNKRVKKESRGKEKWIRLPSDKRYPVFLDYYTAWVDGNDSVHYSSDIYGHDRQLKKLYKQAVNAK